jgi:hypothetical protein
MLPASGSTHLLHRLGSLMHFADPFSGRETKLSHNQGQVDTELLSGFNPAAGSRITQALLGARELFGREREQLLHISILPLHPDRRWGRMPSCAAVARHCSSASRPTGGRLTIGRRLTNLPHKVQNTGM